MITVLNNDVTPQVQMEFTDLETGRQRRKVCFDVEEIMFQIKCHSDYTQYSLDKVIKVNRPTFAEGLDYEKIEGWRRELCTHEKMAL